MFASIRHARILEEIKRSGSVRISSLTPQLEVSEMTVRRDLEHLARKGLVAKVHGGAVMVDEAAVAAAQEPPFDDKRLRETSEKHAISLLAAQLVVPGMSIALTAGTTTWTLAGYLCDIPDLTVVTNSLKVVQVFQEFDRADRTVVLTGGIRTPSDGLVGPVALQSIRSLNVDMVIMGVHGFDLRTGLTTPNMLEAETNRAFVDVARRLTVVADSTKWGMSGLSHIAPLDSVSTLITDDRLEPEALHLLRDQIGEIILVPSYFPDETPSVPVSMFDRQH
ncbi:DeoR/GlpR transcriptional regulator [Nakamurella silvestris]|nr:DeoR/GlpR transcriptional regulator [Nakamurella silvestris]